MIIGPVFARELVTAPRRPRLYLYRFVFPSILFGIMCTAWLILTGTQMISTVGDMSRFGAILFQLLAPLQLAMVIFFAALSTASAVAQEKDRKTLVLLLLTRLNNSELVLGKLCAAMLHVVVMILSGLPVLAGVILFGGTSWEQLVRVFLVTLCTAYLAGSLGSTIALWREKTFQTLALTVLTLVFWILACEGLRAGALGNSWGSVPAANIAIWLSPVRAILAAARPAADLLEVAWYQSDVGRYLLVSLATGTLLNGLAIARVRVWNPSREVQADAGTISRSQESIWGAEHDLALETRQPVERTPANRQAVAQIPHRSVWTNPVLWREVCTWAYGRKILGIRFAYLLLTALAVAGVVGGLQTASADGDTALQRLAWPTIPFFVVSLAIVNALAVNAITNERDGRCLDLLMVTDLSPREFLFGKLTGVLWVTKEMVLLPILLCVYLAWSGAMEWQNFAYIAGGLLTLDLFVATLGLHCGMNYANSRAAITVSLGTVFFLFLGIATCIVMMISFSGAFQVQLAPFLAFILGGGFGLYVALGARNPSGAIFTASLILPFATFYAITSFLMNYTLAVFLVTAVAYGFTTTAMLVPALAEFDFAMGRSASDDE